jgi:hypothetical protein
MKMPIGCAWISGNPNWWRDNGLETRGEHAIIELPPDLETDLNDTEEK